MNNLEPSGGRKGVLLGKLFLTAALSAVMVSQIYKTIRQYDAVKVKAKYSYLNELREHARPLDYVIDVMRSRQPFDPKALKEYIYYYSKVVEYMPTRGDAQGMVGFFYYQAGREEEAIRAYEKAIALNPRFFWSRYNLGVIFFKQKRYEEAIARFKEAVETDPKATIEYILASREIYFPLTSKRVGQWTDLKEMLRAGQNNSMRGIVLSFFYLQHYQDVLDICQYALANHFEDRDFFFYYAGVAAYGLTEYQKSIYMLQESLKGNPGHAESYRYLALALKAVGRDAMAATVMAQGAAVHQKGERPLFDEDELRLEIF